MENRKEKAVLKAFISAIALTLKMRLVSFSGPMQSA